MATTPKLQGPVSSSRAAATTPEVNPSAVPVVAGATPVGFAGGSAFEAQGRASDLPAEGRSRRREGVQDDSIGRTRRDGVQDDSIGQVVEFDSIRDALVGPEADPQKAKLRNALFDQFENPTWASKIPHGAREAERFLSQEIARSAVVESWPSAAKADLSLLLPRLDEKGLRLLASGLEKSPELFSAHDSIGGTLLSNLAKMATQPLNAKLARDTTSETVLRGVLRDVVNPQRIDQGYAPTCTVSSVQFELAADAPAEYARLMADLVGPSGQARMRGGGTLKVETGDAARLARDFRSATETIFQTAAMEYANGRTMDFDPVLGLSVELVTHKTQGGIKPSQLAKLLENIFGVPYSTDDLKDETEGRRVLETLRGFDASRAQNRPVFLHLDQGSSNHTVTLERFVGDRLLFRDPYGVLRSMPEALFPRYVMTIQRPLNTEQP